MSAPPPGDAAPEAASLYAPHGHPGAFFNPWGPQPFGPLTALRWMLSRSAYGKGAEPVVPRVAPPAEGLSGRDGTVTWVGHATFAVEDAGTVVLTDPHFGPRALVPRRLSPPGLPLAAVPGDAFAVLSHNHYDHLDRWTLARLPPGFDWFVPLGMAGWFRRAGIAHAVELDWWQSARRGPWTVTCLPAQHWSTRLSPKRNGALWCSWLLEAGPRRYYFAGDSGYFHGFAEIGRRFPGIDVALLPCGAYEPRWFMCYQHMDPVEAYQAFLDLGARHMVGMHWGTFDLTDEPVDLGPRVLARHAAERGDGHRVRIPVLGEPWAVPAPRPEES